MSFKSIYRISDFAFYLGYKLLKYRLKVVESNLKLAFPSKTSDELLEIQKQFYASFFDNFLETLKLITISNADLEELVIVNMTAEVEIALKSNGNIFFLAPHSGNWEWIAQRTGLLSTQYNLIPRGTYRKQSNAYFNELMIWIRSRFGIIASESNNLFKDLLNENKPYTAFFLADQTAGMNPGVFWTEFLHRKAPFYTGAEKLSKKLKAQCVFIEVTKPRRGHYVMNLSLIKSPEVTKSYVELLESAILKNPSIWLWSHKRWKHSFEEYQSRFPDKSISTQ